MMLLRSSYLATSIAGIFITLCLFGERATGQELVEIGPRVGINISTLGNSQSEFTTRLGWHVGFFYQKFLYQDVALQPELMLSVQGARHKFISNLHLNYTYLSLPLIVKIFPQPFFSISMGLQPAFLLAATQQDDGSSFSISENVANLDFSAVVGISYTKKYGNVGLRYILGINNTSDASVSSETKFQNRVIQIFVAIPIITSPKSQ